MLLLAVNSYVLMSVDSIVGGRRDSSSNMLCSQLLQDGGSGGDVDGSSDVDDSDDGNGGGNGVDSGDSSGGCSSDGSGDSGIVLMVHIDVIGVCEAVVIFAAAIIDSDRSDGGIVLHSHFMSLNIIRYQNSDCFNRLK